MSNVAPTLKASPWAAYVVILAGVVAALQVGKLPPALPALGEALGLTLMQAGFLLSLVQLAGMALGLFVGWAADGWGLRRSMLMGLLVLALASALGGLSQSPQAMLVWRALDGVGFLWVTLPAPALIRRMVAPGHLRSVLGYWGAYMPLGTALTLLAGPLWIPAWGWRSWWELFACLSMGMALLLWRVVPHETPSSSAPGADSAAAAPWPQRLHETLTAPGPWWVALAFAMYSGQWLAVVGFLPSIYTQAGLSGALLGALTALAAAVNMLGNMASGKCLQKGISAALLLAVGYAAMAIGSFAAFGPWTESSAEWRYAGVLLFSCVGGLVPGTLFSLAVRLAPHERNVSTTVGWMQQGSAAGQFSGPPVVAWLASQTGNWHWTWMATGSCSLMGIVLSVLIARTLKRTSGQNSMP